MGLPSWHPPPPYCPQGLPRFAVERDTARCRGNRSALVASLAVPTGSERGWRARLGAAVPAGSERGWRLGLVAVALIVLAGGWYQAVKVPPYYLADEQAHVGYVLELQRGRLPTIDTPIDADRGSEVLQDKMALSPQRNRDIWVAINPPWPYLPAVPVAALTSALGVVGGPLLGVRIVNLLFFAGAAVALARLARRLAGDDPTTGLIAAGLFAALPHVGTTAGAAFVDGAALLCTIAVADALVALTRSGPTRRQVVVLSVWCALATGVRPMTAVVAAVAAGMALGVVTLRWWRTREDGPGEVRPWWAAVVLGLPSLAFSGWVYARNTSLYGDPTASGLLFEKFLREERPLADVFQSQTWAEPVRTVLNRRLTTDVPGPPLWLWNLTRWAVVAFAAATVAIVVADQVAARRGDRAGGDDDSDRTSSGGDQARTPLLGWACTGLSAVVVVVLTAQHWTGGGNIHPRYLLFPAAVVAVMVALPLVRAGARWAGVALVAGVLYLQARQVRQQNAFLLTPTWLPDPPSPFRDPIGPPVLRTLAVVLAGVGFVLFVVAIAAVGGEEE